MLVNSHFIYLSLFIINLINKFMNTKLSLAVISLTFLSIILIRCSTEETVKPETDKKIDLDFLYSDLFTEDNNIKEIEIGTDTDGNDIYTLFFDKEKMSNLKMAVLPGDSINCFDTDCVSDEIEECLDKGGKKVTIIKLSETKAKIKCE